MTPGSQTPVQHNDQVGAAELCVCVGKQQIILQTVSLFSALAGVIGPPRTGAWQQPCLTQPRLGQMGLGADFLLWVT